MHKKPLTPFNFPGSMFKLLPELCTDHGKISSCPFGKGTMKEQQITFEGQECISRLLTQWDHYSLKEKGFGNYYQSLSLTPIPKPHKTIPEPILVINSGTVSLDNPSFDQVKWFVNDLYPIENLKYKIEKMFKEVTQTTTEIKKEEIVV